MRFDNFFPASCLIIRHNEAYASAPNSLSIASYKYPSLPPDDLTSHQSRLLNTQLLYHCKSNSLRQDEVLPRHSGHYWLCPRLPCPGG
jgi:hypothetical protein